MEDVAVFALCDRHAWTARDFSHPSHSARDGGVHDIIDIGCKVETAMTGLPVGPRQDGGSHDGTCERPPSPRLSANAEHEDDCQQEDHGGTLNYIRERPISSV